MADKLLSKADKKDGDLWTNVYNGRVYRWDAERNVWVFTGEVMPIPFLGEFP